MREVWLHTGAAIAFTIQVVSSAQGAEIAPSNERPPRTFDNLGFGSAPVGNGSYGSYSYDFANGFKTEIAGAPSATDDAQEALSTTRMLRGLYEFSDPSWQLKPYIAADLGTVETREKRLDYIFGNWAAYRGGAGATIGLSQKPLETLDNNWVGWKPHLGLVAPEMTSKIGIPSNITQRGIRFGADYHF
jgi:hypothetical protein